MNNYTGYVTEFQNEIDNATHDVQENLEILQCEIDRLRDRPYDIRKTNLVSYANKAMMASEKLANLIRFMEDFKSRIYNTEQ